MLIDTLTYVAAFIVVLTIVVFVHEFGHYWVARRNGVRVEVFSIGFGKELFGWTDRAGTRWRVSPIPLGGYVKFFGDANAASAPDTDLQSKELTPEEKAVSFHHKRVGQRAAVVFAGPAANFVFAILVFAGLFATIGQPFTPPVVGNILEDSAAAEAGLTAGDRIEMIDSQPIERFEDIQSLVRSNPGVPLDVVILRDGSEMSVEVTPRVSEVEDSFGNIHRIGLLGISVGAREYVRLGPAQSLWEGLRHTGGIIVATFQGLGEIIGGDRSAKELGGPILIAQMSGTVVQEGIAPLLTFMAIISISLGLINLFPVPMLDGGHLLFYAFEAVRGRPLGQRAQEYGFRVGLLLVIGLMGFATFNDLTRPSVLEFFSRLTF